MKKITLFLIFSLIALSAQAQYTVYKNGKAYDGEKLEFKTGTLKLTMEGGSSQNFSLDSVDMVRSPQPTSVKGMMNAYYSNKHDTVVQHGAKVYQTNRFLGWGKRAAYFYAMGLLKKGDKTKAKKILSDAAACMKGDQDTLDKQLLYVGLAAVALNSGSTSGCESALKKCGTKIEDWAKPMFYNVQGDLYQKKNKKDQANLSWYKAILVFKGNPPEAAAARAKIKANYAKANDPRAAKLNNVR